MTDELTCLPKFPYYLVEPGEHSYLQFDPEVRVMIRPSLDDVIHAMTGCPRPKRQAQTPCTTDTCAPICRGQCGRGRGMYVGPLEELVAPYWFKATRWGMVSAKVVGVTALQVVMEVYPKWLLKDRVDRTASGLYTFDRMSGWNEEGHYIPEHTRFRIEAYLLPAMQLQARLQQEYLARPSP